MQWLKSPFPLKPVYYVVGQEDFFISEIKETFKKTVISEKSTLDFNHDEVFAGDTSTADLLTLWETLPFMSNQRLIFCYKSDNFQAKDWEKIIPFLHQSIKTTVLVYFFEKKDHRKKHFKILKKQAVELSAEPLPEWKLAPWLDFIAKKEGMEFSSSSKSLFSQMVGPHLKDIQSELKKLKHYLGNNKKASDADVIACTSRLKTESIFQLTESIGKRDTVQALKALTHLLEQNQNEMSILSMLARHIRILSKLKSGEKQKIQNKLLASESGIHPFFLKTYLAQTPLWSEHHINQAISCLLSTDKQLKSSTIPASFWLENFILRTCL